MVEGQAAGLLTPVCRGLILLQDPLLPSPVSHRGQNGRETRSWGAPGEIWVHLAKSSPLDWTKVSPEQTYTGTHTDTCSHTHTNTETHRNQDTETKHRHNTDAHTEAHTETHIDTET